MELLLVFIGGTLFGLFLCLFCDWRSRRRLGWDRPTGTVSKMPGTEKDDSPRQADEGDSIQQVAADGSRPDNWKGIAVDGGIEDPRRTPPGTLIDPDGD